MVHFAGWKVALVFVVCALGIAFAVPNFLSSRIAESLPEWLPHRQISLGLDLQGGSHLLLEVKVDAVVQERLSALVDSARIELRRNRIGYRGLSTIAGGISFTVRDADAIEQARGLVRALDTGTETEVLEEGRIDLESREWQLVEIPLADFGTEEPIESVSFSGNFGGVFYVDDLVLGAIEPPPRSPTAVSGENLAPMPQAFALQRNYPNPFNSQTVIRFALPERRELDLGVYNVAGQRVATLASGWHPAGTHVMQWDGCDDGGRALASGVYLYRLVAGDRFRGTRCMLLLR